MIWTTDIIGNGNSNRFYTSNSGNVIACNIPQHSHKYNTLSIIDTQPLVWMKKNHRVPRVPIYCTKEIKEYALKNNISGDWFPVYEKQSRWNSGIHAANHCAQHSKEIHLWGFDSMFSNDLSSQMDNLVPRNRPPLNKWWHPIWKTVFDAHANVKFVLHCPVGSISPLVAQNLVLSYHKQKQALNSV